jgi:hypothetical protein
MTTINYKELTPKFRKLVLGSTVLITNKVEFFQGPIAKYPRAVLDAVLVTSWQYTYRITLTLSNASQKAIYELSMKNQERVSIQEFRELALESKEYHDWLTCVSLEFLLEYGEPEHRQHKEALTLIS